MIALGTVGEFFKDMEMDISINPNKLIVLIFSDENKHTVRVVVSAELSSEYKSNEISIEDLLNMDLVNRNGIFYLER